MIDKKTKALVYELAERTTIELISEIAHILKNVGCSDEEIRSTLQDLELAY